MAAKTAKSKGGPKKGAPASKDKKGFKSKPKSDAKASKNPFKKPGPGQQKSKKPQKRKASDNENGDSKVKRAKKTDSKTKPSVPQNHKERKELRKTRKASSNKNFEMIEELKRLWEQARVKSITKDERAEKIAAMMKIVEGKMLEIIFQHDSARIIQCCVKYGNAAQRNQIFEELKDNILKLSEQPYSKFLVRRMFQFGTSKHRRHMIQCFYGKVTKLIRKKIAGEILAEAYVDYANAQERASLLEEFFGSEFALFKGSQRRTLEDICTSNPEKKPSIIRHIQKAVQPLLEKGTCAHHILHKALLEYFKIAEGKDLMTMVDNIKELVVEMLHTRDGAKVALICIANASAKDRKVILRTFKGFAVKIACEEYGHQVLLGIFDMVDDTVLVRKTILNELEPALDDLIQDPYARKVLFYLTAHRHKKHFLPQVLKDLESFDENPHSKKDQATRRAELIKAVSPMLLKYAQENCDRMMRTGPEALLLTEIVFNCTGDKNGIYNALTEHTLSEEDALLYHHVAHRVLRTLIDHEETGPDFAEVLSESLKEEDVAQLAAEHSRAAFVMTSVVAYQSLDNCKRIRKLLSAQQDQLKVALKESDNNKGLEALLKALDAM